VSVVFTALLAYATVSAQSGDFSVSGKVVDSTGQPIVNATITYTSIAQRLSWDFSRSDGVFGGPTTRVQPVQQNAAITLQREGPVSIDIFDINGRKLGEVNNAKIDKGTYTLEPVASRLSNSIYVLKIKAGNQVIYRKLLNTGIRSSSTFINQLSSLNAPLALSKRSAVIDSIRVGKTGYAAKYVRIQSYIDNVGNVTLVPVNIEGEVDSVFAIMTQLQKCGQLCMPTIPITSATVAGNFCGSIFGGAGSLTGYTPSTVANMVDSFQTAMMGTSLKIPILATFDFVHGASDVPGATIFPHNLAMGAIQDTLLVQKAFRAQALEVRGSGCNWGLGPCIAVIRDDRWGRAYEGFCETPERTQIMARHAILGIQTTDLSMPTSYAATCKHFAGDGNTTNGVNAGTTAGPDSVARAINLPGYASAVAAGVATIMPSFSSWCDGTPMHNNATLMTGWLKSPAAGNPNFQGFIVGDWDGATLPGSILAGLDVPMAPEAGLGTIATINGFYAANQARLDDAVKRVLRVKAWMGLLNPSPQYLTDRRLTALVGCAAHRDVARACVRASLVLLKNDTVGGTPVLPIPTSANVAIWGTAGDNIGIQCGGFTVSWQGQSGAIPGGGGTSVRTAVQSICSNASYIASPTGSGTSDYIIAFLSENPYAEVSFPDINMVNDATNNGTSGNMATATNSTVVTQIQTAHVAGKKVIVVLIAGRPLDISTVIPNCDAFVWAGLPGTEGEGVSDVLFATGYKFSGKLPFTWPTGLSQEPINYGDGQTGLFAYGYGLTD